MCVLADEMYEEDAIVLEPEEAIESDDSVQNVYSDNASMIDEKMVVEEVASEESESTKESLGDDNDEEPTDDSSNGQDADIGESVYIGMYPQSIVTDASLISELEALELDASNDAVYRSNKYRLKEGNWYRYEPIEWIVLSKEGDDAVLVSKIILEKKVFYEGNGNWVHVNYKDSSVRTWLNYQFINTAFSDKEISQIRVSTIENSEGDNTQDKIYLPLREELSSLDTMVCGYSDYIKEIRSSYYFTRKTWSAYYGYVDVITVISGVRAYVFEDEKDAAEGIRPCMRANIANIPSSYVEDNNDDPIIVVSMGDSFSSGEGIEPFYGQDKTIAEKVQNFDWIGHRSFQSWPAYLEIPGIQGTMSKYKYDKEGDRSSYLSKGKWYFVASSGAKTKHFSKEKQKKTIRREGFNHHWKYTTEMPLQMDVFEIIDGQVDYVTLTIGGNDVDFGDVIAKCALKSTYLGSRALEDKLGTLWVNIGKTREDIKAVLRSIKNKTSNKTKVLVAGYPQLLDPNGKGFTISKREAELVNSNVHDFNNEIRWIVESFPDEMNIYYVNVEGKFKNHQAYSDDAWINPIILGPMPEELDDLSIYSAYSMHPNDWGARAYAECVNEKIKSILKQSN